MDEFFYFSRLFSNGFLFVLAAILPIINPLAMAPTFLALTETIRHQGLRDALAWRIGRNAALMLGVTMLVGSYVLEIFGISLAIVRVGGGMIVVSIGWKLLNSTSSASSSNGRQEMAEEFTPEQVRDRAFYPMTFPLSCGPGSIAASIAVGASLHDPQQGLQIAYLAGALLANVAIGMAIYFTYRFANKILEPLGKTGLVVFLRLSAFILLCVGVQIVWAGVSELVRDLLLNLPSEQAAQVAAQVLGEGAGVVPPSVSNQK